MRVGETHFPLDRTRSRLYTPDIIKHRSTVIGTSICADSMQRTGGWCEARMHRRGEWPQELQGEARMWSKAPARAGCVTYAGDATVIRARSICLGWIAMR